MCFQEFVFLCVISAKPVEIILCYIAGFRCSKPNKVQIILHLRFVACVGYERDIVKASIPVVAILSGCLPENRNCDVYCFEQ